MTSLRSLVVLLTASILILPTSLPSVAAQAVAADKSALQPLWLADYAAMRQLDELGKSQAKEENWQNAAVYFARAGELGTKIPGLVGMWLDFAAIDAYLRAAQNDKALAQLSKTAKRGFRFPEHIENNPIFGDIKDSPDYQKSLKTIKKAADTYRDARRNPEDAKLIFNDVPRFWAAYDLAEKEKYASGKAAVFRRHYLAPGSIGLIDYHWGKTKTMERLVQKIEESPAFYQGIRAQTLKAASFEAKIRAGFRQLKTLYADAFFPDVTFVIGRLNSGGTAGASGMLIGLDVWSWTPGVSLEGVSPGFQKILTSNDLERLPYIVIHEHIHSLQAYSGESNILRGVLQEGSADFLALKALPEAKPPVYFEWGFANEEKIWRRFQQEMDGNDFSNWIGNNNTDHGDDWHADLGYFLGAQISKAYFEQAEDKQQAIRDLLIVNDAKSILEKSGYGSKFKN